MSRLTDLIAQVKTKDPQVGADLEEEFKALGKRRAFGLNFERHKPEEVELPGRPVRRGDKVRVLPERGSTNGDPRLWVVTRVQRIGSERVARLRLVGDEDAEEQSALVEDLVVVAGFGDAIYPGLVETGRVERGSEQDPYHTVINAENYHALRTLTYTHRGKVDCIYIDPPYNTGDKSWKYNNNYVEGDDLYRHSKWLAFMERRLKVARELLNPEDSVLIVTIDEKEYLRLGLLLEQTFPEAKMTMVSSSINNAGASRLGTFGRAAEFLFFLRFGASRVRPLTLSDEWNPVGRKSKYDLLWNPMIRTGTDVLRTDSPSLFFPVFIRPTTEGPEFHAVGEPHYGPDWQSVQTPEDCFAVWPIRQNGDEGRWQVGPAMLRELIEAGHARLGKWRGSDTTVYYLKRGERAKLDKGLFSVTGRRSDGSVVTDSSGYEATFIPTDVWRIKAHDAGHHGSSIIRALIPGRKFDFPKSLYAVEDALRFFVSDNPDATVLDFFSGSGTTAQAVMRLNRQDGGSRQCISVTNNEVSAVEQKILRKQGLRPGDPDWEAMGICDHVTKPRIKAAITGVTPAGEPVKGDYKFTDEFPMAEGFAANARFFTLTYETPISVSHNRAFARIAPLLWLRAGATGRELSTLSKAGWEVADTYALLHDLDTEAAFLKALKEAPWLRIAYIVTDDAGRFESVSRSLPESIEPVRLYESYLTNLAFLSGD